MRNRTGWISRARLMVLLTPFLLVANGICQDEPQTVNLTRTDAIALAIRNNIDLRVRALDSALVKTDITSNESIYNPTLNASIDYAQTYVAGEKFGTETTSGALSATQLLPTGATVSLATRTAPTSAYSDPLYDYTDWSTSIGITVYQPLFKNAGKEATELGINLSQYAYTGSLEDFRDNLLATIFSVITEYNRLYVLHQLLESRRAAWLSAQQLLEELNARPNPGASHQIEIANAEYTLSQRQTELIEAERQVSSREDILRYLIGRDDKPHIIPVDPPSREEPPETEEQAIALALKQRPDLQELRIQLQASELREKVSRQNVWPSLALTASGGYRGYAQEGTFSDTVDQILDGKGEYWAAGLLFSYPLGNDLAESEYLRNRLRSEQLKKQIIAAEWKIRDTIQEDNRSLISARLQLRSTAKSKLLAEQRVAQYQENRRLGTASVKDLIDAENDLIFARNLELNAVENFAFLVTRLWRDIGVLLERQNIHIDTTRPEQITSADNPPLPVDSAPPTAAPNAPNSPASAPAVPAETAAVSVALKQPRAVPAGTVEQSAGAVSYTLQIGEYFAPEMTAVKKKIEQAGLVPVVMESGKQKREVIRLVLGEYQDRQAAEQALAPLKNTHSAGFVLKNAGGGYDAFAGSFFTEHDAEAEQARLAARGITLKLRKVSVAMPTYLLTAGSFSSLETAREGANKLGQQGLDVEIRQSRG